MPSTTFISSIVLALTALTAASPIETRNDYPEVVPGPGLPSLESLGLTSAQLYEMPVPSLVSRNVLSANFVGKCGPAEAAYTQVNGVIACYNYLNALGTTQCGVSGSKVAQFCYSGDAQAVGQSITERDESSYCRDVATGLLWVIDHCTRNNDHTVAGFNAANGNGNLIVGGVSKSW